MSVLALAGADWWVFAGARLVHRFEHRLDVVHRPAVQRPPGSSEKGVRLVQKTQLKACMHSCGLQLYFCSYSCVQPHLPLIASFSTARTLSRSGWKVRQRSASAAAAASSAAEVLLLASEPASLPSSATEQSSYLLAARLLTAQPQEGFLRQATSI